MSACDKNFRLLQWSERFDHFLRLSSPTSRVICIPKLGTGVDLEYLVIHSTFLDILFFITKKRHFRNRAICNYMTLTSFQKIANPFETPLVKRNQAYCRSDNIREALIFANFARKKIEDMSLPFLLKYFENGSYNKLRSNFHGITLAIKY